MAMQPRGQRFRSRGRGGEIGEGNRRALWGDGGRPDAEGGPGIGRLSRIEVIGERQVSSFTRAVFRYWLPQLVN